MKLDNNKSTAGMAYEYAPGNTHSNLIGAVPAIMAAWPLALQLIRCHCVRS
jgi:hypothetical protein